MWWSIAIGGALGALARAGIMQIAPKNPLWMLLLVNAIGCIVLGWLSQKELSHALQSGLGIGFCGAFTTFSTWILLQNGLIEQQSYLKLFIYLALSLFSGFGMLILGKFLAQ